MARSRFRMPCGHGGGDDAAKQMQSARRTVMNRVRGVKQEPAWCVKTRRPNRYRLHPGMTPRRLDMRVSRLDRQQAFDTVGSRSSCRSWRVGLTDDQPVGQAAERTRRVRHEGHVRISRRHCAAGGPRRRPRWNRPAFTAAQGRPCPPVMSACFSASRWRTRCGGFPYARRRA